MALLYADDFDHYTALAQRYTPQISGSSVTAGIEAGQGRYGTGAASLASVAVSVAHAVHQTKNFPARATVVCGLALWLPPQWNSLGATAAEIQIRVRDGATPQVMLSVLPNGQIKVWRGDRATELGVGSGAQLLPETWYFLELKATIHNTAGSVEARLNGTAVFTFTGNTRQTANNRTDGCSWGLWVNASAGNGNLGAGNCVYIDDFYIADTTGAANNDFLGDRRVKLLAPIAAGAHAAWTASAGTALDCVDDAAPNDDSDYVATAGAGNKVDFGHASSGLDLASEIKAAIVRGRLRKDDAGARTARAFCRVNGTDYFHATAFALSDSWAYYDAAFEANPATGAAWTVAEVTAAEFGWQLVS